MLTNKIPHARRPISGDIPETGRYEACKPTNNDFYAVFDWGLYWHIVRGCESMAQARSCVDQLNAGVPLEVLDLNAYKKDAT